MNSDQILKRIQLGQAIAKMYIAAQGISLQASDAACDALDFCDRWQCFGFNQEMARSPYNVRATEETSC